MRQLLWESGNPLSKWLAHLVGKLELAVEQQLSCDGVGDLRSSPCSLLHALVGFLTAWRLSSKSLPRENKAGAHGIFIT